MFQVLRKGSRALAKQKSLFSSHSRQTVLKSSSISCWNSFDSSSSSSSSYGFVWVALALAFGGASIAECSGKKDEEKHWRIISRKEVEKHNIVDKHVWVTYKDSVYDVTNFLSNHPGGKEKLMSVAGKDISSQWALYVHHKTSPLAHELLEEMKIGVLPKEDIIEPPVVTHVAKYSNEPVYDAIIIGGGMSGLQCGWSLINQHKVDPKKILILEAQDYVGGRVKQVTEFVKGAKIEVGAEFLHGNGTELTKFARAHNEPLREIFCWAHGDGGPLEYPVDKGYGLYYIGKSDDLNAPNAYRLPKPYQDGPEDIKLNKQNRLLRYDDTDPDFVALNNALWNLAYLQEDDYDESLSLYDYFVSKKLNTNMLKMGEGGYSNTLCSNSDELSLKQAIKWSRIWHNEATPDAEEDGDYTFKNSYACLVNHLQKELQIEINTPVQHIDYPPLHDDHDHHQDGLVTVTTKEGKTYQTRNIVLTASPHVIQNKLITFSPPLPEEIEEAFHCVKMNSITKVILKFRKPVWPKDLHGMIMTDDSFLVPEIWFRIVEDEIAPGEEATAYAVGFTTAKYQERVSALSQEEVFQRVISQLDTVFSQLQPHHMSANPNDPDNVKALVDLPNVREQYLGGMFWDWRPSHHPYIGGGYCSPLAGKPITIGDILKKGNGKHMFFAGEATNHLPGATAHAAMETGIRAAEQVATALGSDDVHKKTQ